MKVTAEKNEQVAKFIFASIYPLYLDRLIKNGRTKEELDQVIKWFTGFDQDTLQTLIDEKVSFRTFFQKATIHPNAHLIKGVVCGYRIEEMNLNCISNADKWKSSLMSWQEAEKWRKFCAK